MRKLSILLLLLNASANAQPSKNTPFVKDVSGRIHLGEKMNQPLSILPRMMLTAFCQGQLKAYYPNRPGKEMSFDNFVAYFNIPYKPLSDSTTCTCDLCKNLDEEFISAFSEFLDYNETEQFNTASSRYSYETKYFRLVLPAKYTWQDREYQGPVFRYEDVVKVFPAPVFFNRQNDAAYYTLRHIFSTRLFNPVIKPEKDMFGQPVLNEQSREPEHEEWEN